MAAASTRTCAAWTLSLIGLAGSLLGWLGLYAVASTFAAGTVWWVGAGFLASAPVAVGALVVSLRQPRLSIPAWLSSAALFVFAALWILILALKMAK